MSFSRALFAIAAAGFAIYSLVYADFAPAGASLPVWIPGRATCVIAAALIVLAASAGLCFVRTAVISVLTIAAYHVVWALIGIPQVLSKPLDIGAWYGICEPLSVLAGAVILWALLRWPSRGSAISIADERVVRTGQVLFGLTCVFYGWSHFAYADYTASMVPSVLPVRLGLAYFTGIAHVAAGLGLIVGVLPRLAGNLEALMMSLFGLLVWVPSFFTHPRPAWATPPQNQWSELVVNLVLAAAAWIVASSLKDRSWGFATQPRRLSR